MTIESQRIIFEQLTQARQKFIYFLLTMNFGMIGFIAYLVIDPSINIGGIWHLFFLISAILHGISVCLGLLYLVKAQDILYKNFKLLNEIEGTTRGDKDSLPPSKSPEMLKIESQLKWYFSWSLRLLISGVLFFTFLFIIFISIN